MYNSIRKIVFIIILTNPLINHAQVEVYNTSLVDSSLHVFYKYYNNWIKVSGLNNYNDIQLILGNSNFFSDQNQNMFIIYLNKVNEPIDTLKILQHDSIIYVCPVRISQIPEYEIICGNNADTAKSVDEILASPFLQAILPNCDYKCRLKIVRFSVDFYINNSDLRKAMPLRTKDYIIRCEKTNATTTRVNAIERYRYIETELKTGEYSMKKYKCKVEINFDDSLNTGQLEIIKKMKSGDYIYFYDIIGRVPNGCDLAFPPIIINIK